MSYVKVDSRKAFKTMKQKIIEGGIGYKISSEEHKQELSIDEWKAEEQL